jgi:hypothetical protein
MMVSRECGTAGWRRGGLRAAVSGRSAVAARRCMRARVVGAPTCELLSHTVFALMRRTATRIPVVRLIVVMSTLPQAARL